MTMSAIEEMMTNWKSDWNFMEPAERDLYSRCEAELRSREAALEAARKLESSLLELRENGKRVSIRSHNVRNRPQQWSCEIEDIGRLGLYRSRTDETRIKEFSDTPAGALQAALAALKGASDAAI
jgi:hypothetical protein